MAYYYTYHNPQNGDSRWSKPSFPGADKTAFDFCGKNAASNAATPSSSHTQHVQAEILNGKGSSSAGSFPFASDPGSSSAPSITGAAAKIIGGGAMALLGLPLLILPGPGLLCILGVLALAASGVNDLKKSATC